MYDENTKQEKKKNILRNKYPGIAIMHSLYFDIENSQVKFSSRHHRQNLN